jgi:hypothetical protein
VFALALFLPNAQLSKYRMGVGGKPIVQDLIIVARSTALEISDRERGWLIWLRQGPVPQRQSCKSLLAPLRLSRVETA